MSGFKFGGGGVPCTKCGKTSYPAETITFEEKPFHKDCFRCTECQKKMEGTSHAAFFDAKLYCNSCFTKKGFARNQTRVTWTKKTDQKVSANSMGLGGGGTPCNVCGKTVFGGEAAQYEGKTYHRDCMKCTECQKACTVNTVSIFENKLYCQRCFAKNRFAEKQAKVKFEKKDTTSANYNRFPTLGGGGDKCDKCGGTVYSAELIVYEERKYHAKCFKCTHCGKELKPSVAQHNNKQPYCTKCYTELGLHHAQLKKKESQTQPTTTTASASATSSSPAPVTTTTPPPTTTTTTTPPPTATTTAAVTTESVPATTTTTAPVTTEPTPATTAPATTEPAPVTPATTEAPVTTTAPVTTETAPAPATDAPAPATDAPAPVTTEAPAAPPS